MKTRIVNSSEVFAKGSLRAQDYLTPYNTLNELFEAMQANDPSVLDKHGQWSTDLPTFGGPTPTDTHEIWSWDVSYVIVGTCNDDLSLVKRS